MTKQLLVDSHLFPAAIIRHCGEQTLKNKDAVWVSSTKIKRTGKAITDYVLCEPCDNSLNKYGEGWVSRHTARADGSFLLQAKLNAAKPMGTIGKRIFYAGSKIQDVQMDKLIHFAIGVFWKAAVHKWKINGEEITGNTLGCGN
jgi:hypothetical protein